MSNQPQSPTSSPIDTSGMTELATRMEQNVSHAAQIISDTLAHSRQLMAHIHYVHQQNQANQDHAPEQFSGANNQCAQVPAGSGIPTPTDPVADAVNNIAQQEQGAFQHMQQQAQQHFQHAGQALEQNPMQLGAQTDPNQQSPHGFAESVASTLHHGVEQGENMIQRMKEDAQKHMHDAEQAIQQSLSSIHHAIEGQGKVFAQQQMPAQTPAENSLPQTPEQEQTPQQQPPSQNS